MEAVQRALADLATKLDANNAKLDAQTTTFDTKLAAVDASLAATSAKFDSITTDVKRLATHVADVQDDVESVKRSQVVGATSSILFRDITNRCTGGRVGVAFGGFNDPGAPGVLGGPPRGALPPGQQLPDATEVFVERPEPVHQRLDTVKPPKHQFPRFLGDNPYLWLDLCDTYFAMYQTACHQRVSTAILHLEGHAALWLQAYKRRTTLGTWE